MNNINIKKVCRTCITECEEMLDIYSSVNSNGNILTIVKMLNHILTTKIVENDKYPNLICSQCIKVALNAYNFKLQCDRSYLVLQQCIKKLEPKYENDFIEFLDYNFNNNILFTNENENDSNKCILESCINVEVKNCNKPKNLKPKTIKNNLVSKNKELLRRLEESNNFSPNELGLIYHCPKCNKSFKNRYIFNAHEKRHKFKGQYLCNVCGKGFSSPSCLTRHNRVHTGEKKYECSECHKRFPSSNNLNLHTRIHSGLKPYLCTVCGKRFSHPTGLTYHMRTHTNEKPYVCELCGKKFAIQCHYHRHKMTHSGERPFGCSQCGKAFVKKNDLQRHEEIHTGLKPYTCSVCKKSFLRIKNFKFHLMLHTEECGKGFIRLYYLRDHMKKHHNLI